MRWAVINNLNLIKLAAARTASDSCSMFTVYTLSDLIWEYPSLFINDFEQAMKSFLVWNIYFIFLKQWLIAIFYKSTEE